MKVTMIKHNGGLFAYTDEDYEKLRRFKEGEAYEVSVKLKRNIAFHRKYFALINTAWEYLTETQERMYGNKENFRKTLQMTAGYFEPVFDIMEKRFLKSPSSISFDKMSQEEFEDLYERVKDVLMKYVLKNIPEEELLANIIDF